MISTVPSGSAIANETPDPAASLPDVPQSSADFRPEGPVPETLANLLPFADKNSRRRWNKTFKLLVEWKGPAETVLLKCLFRRSAMDGFRPFLWERGYLENTIVFHRKGLGYLRNLAASRGVQVEPVYKEAWRPVMALADEHHCMVFAERFEAAYESPADVTPEAVRDLAYELVRTRQKHMAGAKKAKAKFLCVLRQCGFIAKQLIAAARADDYGEPLEEFSEPLKSEVEGMRDWSVKVEDDSEWEMDWGDDDTEEEEEEETYLALRRVTSDRSIAEICCLYGFVKNICHKEMGINSLETLFSEKILRRYKMWLKKVRRLKGGSMRTMFGSMFSMVKHYSKTQHIDLTWTTAFIKSLPKTSQNERNARKANRIVHFRTLEMIPDKIRKDVNILIARHNQAERAEQKRTTRRKGNSSEKKIGKARTTRLLRIATLAQSAVITKYLITLAWRNENLCELRANPDLSDRLVDGKKPNLWRGPVFPVPDMEIPDWAQELIDDDPSIPLLQFSFDANETKAGRPVMAVLPKTLIDITVEFVSTWRKILVCGVEDPGTLFVNQAGTSMTQEQMEWAAEEATLRYGGDESKAVNPHLFRDIFAAAWLRDPDHYADYLTLSKILWHENVEVTVRTYSWIFNESVGTNAAGNYAEKRELKNRLRQAGIEMPIVKHATVSVPALPPPGYRQRAATLRGKK